MNLEAWQDMLDGWRSPGGALRGVLLVVIAALAIGAGTLAACGDEERAPLKIGALLVNSEAQTETALDRLRSFKLAIKHVNEAGGVFGQQVEIAEGDTLNPAEEARRLIEDEGVHAIVGPNSSAGSAPGAVAAGAVAAGAVAGGDPARATLSDPLSPGGRGLG